MRAKTEQLPEGLKSLNSLCYSIRSRFQPEAVRLSLPERMMKKHKVQ